jgi:hypothetical protein
VLPAAPHVVFVHAPASHCHASCTCKLGMLSTLAKQCCCVCPACGACAGCRAAPHRQALLHQRSCAEVCARGPATAKQGAGVSTARSCTSAGCSHIKAAVRGVWQYCNEGSGAVRRTLVYAVVRRESERRVARRTPKIVNASPGTMLGQLHSNMHPAVLQYMDELCVGCQSTPPLNKLGHV